MLKLIWTDQALSDLEKIEAFIASDNRRAALCVSKQVYRDVRFLRRNPYLDRIGQIEGTREFVVQRLPYLVIYETPPGCVLSVFHTSRALWLGVEGADEEV